MIRLVGIVLTLSLLMGCQSAPPPKAGQFKPLSLDASNEIYRVCEQTLGVSCSMNEQLNQLTIAVNMAGTPEETQHGVVFISTYYCRLSRVEGNDENRVLLLRPDGTQVGRSCSSIGTVENE